MFKEKIFSAILESISLYFRYIVFKGRVMLTQLKLYDVPEFKIVPI